MKVLVVDDDQAVREALQRALRLAGFDVEVAADGLAALDAHAARPPHAIVLDVGMPDPDGLAVARRLRADGATTPILMLTAHGEVAARVAGLDAGADDYLAKPFALEELLARLRAITRRVDDSVAETAALSYDDVTMDPTTVTVRRGGRDVRLTRTEWLLLQLFLENPERVLSREVINDAVWGLTPAGASNSVEVYVGYLRRKLEEGGGPRLIHTIRGFGYVLRRD